MDEPNDAWGHLADDLPAAPRSVLEPFVEASARDDPLPSPRPRPVKQGAETEMWLLRRACTAACLLALKVRSDLDADSLAQLAADRLHDKRRAALVENIVAISTHSTGAAADPPRIVDTDPVQVINGLVDTIVLATRIVAEHTDVPVDKIVRGCFAAADGSIPAPE